MNFYELYQTKLLMLWKLCYMDTYSFIVNTKTEDVYEYIADDVEKRFGTSNYEIDKPLPIVENKKVIRLMED